MMIAVASALAYVLLLGSAQADKDDSYYIAGTGNPNRNEKMYWKDAENIFQDLSEFSSLYVEFHNCAWTWMQTSEQDNDIDENDYWYMGKIPPMGANVAYSLYGSLKGETFGGCGEDTFINSFYTNSGFTNFARAMNYAGLSGFSSYSYDDDSSSSYTAACGGGYGVGCDYSNGFAVHTYAGDECNPANYTGVKDKLSSLNSAMKAATCVKIFDSNKYYGSPYGTPLELLAYSHSCFYQDFFSPDGICPDPYGKLAYYQQQFYNGIQESKKQDPYQVSQRRKTYTNEIKKGKLLSAVGLLLATLAFIIMAYEVLVACFGYKEVEMRRFVPRQQDFIITRRSKDEDLETPTVGERSDTSSEHYVTMSTTYTPPMTASPPIVQGIETTPAPATSSPQVPAPQPEVTPTPVVPPQPAVAPTPVTPPQPVIAPTPVAPPQPEATPTPVVPPQPVVAPPQPAAVPTPVAPPKPAASLAPVASPQPAPLPTTAQEEVASPKVVVVVMQPPATGSKVDLTSLEGLDIDEPYTVVQAPSMNSETAVIDKQVVAETKAKEAPELPADDEVKAVGEEVKESPKVDESSVTNDSPENETDSDEVVLPPCLQVSPSADAPSSSQTGDVTQEAPPLTEAPSQKSLGEVEKPALLKCDSKSGDDIQKTTDVADARPDSLGDMSQPMSSQYFDANESESASGLDEIEMAREDDTVTGLPSDEDQDETQEASGEAGQQQDETQEASGEAGQQQDETQEASGEAREQQDEEEADQDLEKSSSWFSFTI